MSDSTLIPPSPSTATVVIAAGEASSRAAAPVIPDHELCRCIGAGSYGEVWLAKSALGTWRAVKIVHRRTFESDRPYEREFEGIKNFEPISREHEGQVDILQVGRNDEAGYFYYVMELADDAGPSRDAKTTDPDATRRKSDADRAATPGSFDPQIYTPKTLRSEFTRRGRLPFEECLQVGLSLAQALAHLHGHKLIHRDIKLANVVLVRGLPKLADVGLVTDTSGSHTLVGTEGYFPPEGPGAPQADIYSLGKVLYEIATGRDRTDFPELPTHLDEWPDREGVLRFNQVVLKACDSNRERRYQSATEMHADLLRLQKGEPVTEAPLTGSVTGLLRQFKASKTATAIGSLAILLVVALAAKVVMDNSKLAKSAGEAAVPPPKSLPGHVAGLPAGGALALTYSQTPPAAPAGTARPQLQFELLARRRGQPDFSVMRDGDTLASEVDDYMMAARPLHAGWLYVFQVDAAGKVDWLFPRNAGSAFSSGANPVEPSRVVQIPAADSDRVLFLDKTAGIEHIYVVFSATRWGELETELAKQPAEPAITAKPSLAATLQEPNRLLTRGVGGSRVNPASANVAEVLALERVHQGKSYKLPFAAQTLEASSSFLVVERWFRHVNAQ